MENLKKSLALLLKRNFNEIKDLVNSFDKEEFEKELEEGYSLYRDIISDRFNALKSKLVRLKNGKYTIVVPYDRDNQTMTFSVNDGEKKTFEVSIKSCEDCDENSDTESTFISKTILPKNVLIDNINQVYDNEKKEMTFEFESKDIDEEDLTEEISGSEEFSEVVEDEDFENTEEETDEEKETPTKEQICDKMVEMHNDGISFKKIAKEFGVSDKTVARWIRNRLA